MWNEKSNDKIVILRGWRLTHRTQTIFSIIDPDPLCIGTNNNSAH